MRAIWSELSTKKLLESYRASQRARRSFVFIDLTTSDPVTADEEQQEIEDTFAELVYG